MLWVLICTVHLTVCSYHATYASQNESTLYSCLNVKELLARNRCGIWSLSVDSNRIWTHNHLVCKRALTHLTKLAISIIDILFLIFFLYICLLYIFYYMHFCYICFIIFFYYILLLLIYCFFEKITFNI